MKKNDGLPPAAQSQRMRDQLRVTQDVIQSLLTQIDFYRRQNQVLLEERASLLKLRSRLDELRSERGEAESEFGRLKQEQERLNVDLRDSVTAGQELSHRCALLESALASERARTAELRGVIACLEEQIDQLETMVHLLSEHEELRRLEERLEESQLSGEPSLDPKLFKE